MVRKRILINIMSLGLVTSALFSCSVNNENKTPFSDNPIKISLVTDKNGIEDKGLNQQSYIGLEKIKKENNAEIDVLVSKDYGDYEKNIKDGAKKSTLTFAVGEDLNDAIGKVAKDLSSKEFAIIDGEVTSSNVKIIKFKEEDGAFLMGVIAGKMTKSDKVGFVGGLEGKIENRFLYGYIAGVKTVNAKAADDLLSGKAIRYIGNYEDEKKGYSASKELYSYGCDVIFQVCGLGAGGGFKAAQESGKWALGANMDQALEYPQYKTVILSSVIKRSDKVTYEVSKESISGRFKGGKDNILVLGLDNGGIEIASTTPQNTPKDVVDLVEKYKLAIIKNAFKVPSTAIEVREFAKPNI